MSGHYSHWLHYTGDRLSGFERLRVDAAQTSFFEGREFRMFKELSLAAGTSLVIKVVVPVNVILTANKLTLVDGWVRMSTVSGGTEGGTFADALPKFAKNLMTDRRKTYGDGTQYYTSVLTLSSGGTLVGGTELDVVLVRTSNATAQAAAVSDSSTTRGVVPGTYYFKLTNMGSGTASGVLHVEWEERP